MRWMSPVSRRKANLNTKKKEGKLSREKTSKWQELWGSLLQSTFLILPFLMLIEGRIRLKVTTLNLLKAISRSASTRSRENHFFRQRPK